MKKYLIMSLAMAACSVMVSGCATDGSAGEDTDGSIQEAPASAHVIPEGTAEPVIQESIVQEPFSETEDIGNSDADSADLQTVQILPITGYWTCFITKSWEDGTIRRM